MPSCLPACTSYPAGHRLWLAVFNRGCVFVVTVFLLGNFASLATFRGRHSLHGERRVAGDCTPGNSVQNENGTEIGEAHYGLNTAKNISWNKATKREENMQPIIKINAWYTLVTGKSEVINASWCKQQLARILKKSTDAIILFDVTGSYAALVLDHDRLIPGQVPMAVKQYKSTPKGFALAHTVKVDVEDSQEPRLLVFDVSWVMAFSWKKGIAAITKILKVWMMCEPQAEPIWLFLNIDPYGFELSDSESWECLERIVKDKEFKVKPVFLTKGKTEREINERLHIKA